MKNILYLVIALIAYTSAQAAGVWGEVKNVHPDPALTNNRSGYMYAYKDSIMVFDGFSTLGSDFNFFIKYTTDSGKNWAYALNQSYFDSLSGYLMSEMDWNNIKMQFIPPSTIQLYLIYKNVRLLSTDWGKSWSKKELNFNLPKTSDLEYAIHTIDTLKQVVKVISSDAELNKKVYFTYDGWNSYDSTKAPVETGYGLVFMVSDSEFFCKANYKDLLSYYSKDRGKTWQPSKLPFDYEGYCTSDYRSFIPEKRMMFLAGGHYYPYNGSSSNYGNSMVWKSTDAGASWKVCLYAQDTCWQTVHWMDINSDGIGLVLSEHSNTGPYKGITAMYLTSDYGETWEKAVFDTSCPPMGWSFHCAIGSKKNAWAYIHPYIFRYFPGGVVKVDDTQLSGLSSNSCTIYPNPVGRGKTVYLPFNEGIASGTIVKIYSLLGELIDEYIPEESTKLLSYRPDEKLVKGNYYFLIESGDKKITKTFTVE